MSAVYCVMPRMSAGAAAADAVTNDSAEALAERPIIFKSTGPGIEALQTAGAVARFTITAQETVTGCFTQHSRLYLAHLVTL